MGIRTILAGGIVFAVLLTGGADASAGDFTMRFDDAGFGTGFTTHTPGADSEYDGHAHLSDVVVFEGTNDGGAITIPANGVSIKDETNLVQPSNQIYTMSWQALTPLTGTYSADTGQLDLSGMIQQTIVEGNNTCTAGPLDLKLSTETQTSGNHGVRFADGLEGDGILDGGWSGLFVIKAHGCDTDALSCDARLELARKAGLASLATSARLGKGMASMNPCHPPTVVTPKPRVTRTTDRLLVLPKSNRLEFAQVTCPGPMVGCQITSVKSEVKVKGRRYRSSVEIKRDRLLPNEVAKATLTVGPNARSNLVKGAKSGSARITFEVTSDDETVKPVTETVGVGLTR